jgi:hypothetical protein
MLLDFANYITLAQEPHINPFVVCLGADYCVVIGLFLSSPAVGATPVTAQDPAATISAIAAPASTAAKPSA